MGFSPLAYPNTRQTFFVSALAVAPASGKSMISLETTTANIVLRLHAIQLYNVQSGAVVGVNAQFDLTRFTSHSAGALLTVTSNDTLNSLSSGATARTGATLVGEVATPLRSWFVNLDDISAGAAQNQGLGSLFGQNWQFLSDATMQPPTIRQNQGLSIRCATATVVGTVNVALLFTQDTN